MQILLSNSDQPMVAAGANFLYQTDSALEDQVTHLRAGPDGIVRLGPGVSPLEYLVWHRHGARRAAAKVPDEPTETTIVLAPAGAIVVSAPTVRGAFTARIEKPTGATSSVHDLRVEAESRDGIAVCEGVPAAWDEVSVRVVRSGNTVGTAKVRVEAGRDVSVSVRPASPCAVRGVVVDDDGLPLAGVFVTLSPEDEVRVQERCRQAETTADGEFVMPAVDLARMKLALTKRKHGLRRLIVDCSSGSDLDLGRITLTRGRAVRGRVQHAGAAAFGSLLQMRPKLTVGFVSVDSLPAGFSVADRAGIYEKGRIESDGAFEILGLAPGTYVVFACDKLSTEWWNGVVTRVENRDVEGVTIDLGHERVWRCELRTTDGASMRATEVMATSSTLRWYASAPLDDHGRAELQVGQGPFLVGFRLGRETRWVHRSPGTLVSEQVTVPNGSLSVRGLDVATAGDPAFAECKLTYVAGQLPSEFLPLTMSAGSLAVDSAGQHVVPHLLPGKYRLEMRAPNWGRREIVFDLHPGENLVRVWSEASGR